jgi:Asp/Glu/hydantoin racemase
MQQAIRQNDVPVDFFTPSSKVSPPGIEGTFDSIVSAAGVLEELKGRLDEWDGVSCGSEWWLMYSLLLPVSQLIHLSVLFEK